MCVKTTGIDWNKLQVEGCERLRTTKCFYEDDTATTQGIKWLNEGSDGGMRTNVLGKISLAYIESISDHPPVYFWGTMYLEDATDSKKWLNIVIERGHSPKPGGEASILIDVVLLCLAYLKDNKEFYTEMSRPYYLCGETFYQELYTAVVKGIDPPLSPCRIYMWPQYVIRNIMEQFKEEGWDFTSLLQLKNRYWNRMDKEK